MFLIFDVGLFFVNKFTSYEEHNGLTGLEGEFQ